MKHAAKLRFGRQLTSNLLQIRRRESLVDMRVSAPGATQWLVAAAVVIVLLATTPVVGAQDTIELGSAVALRSGIARVPVRVRLAPTATGGADGSGAVQAISFRVRFDPASAVVSARVLRAGILAGLKPLFESTPGSTGTLGYLASFDERTNPVLFRSGATGEPDLVAELELRLAPGLPEGFIVLLELEPETSMLSNRAGTDIRSVSGGTLSLFGSTVVVAKRTHEPGPRPGAGTEE